MSNIEKVKGYFSNKLFQAKDSLSKLLKVKPDYANGKFEVVEFD